MRTKYPLHDFSQMPTFSENCKAEGEILELWQTPEGKLFFKKEDR